MSLTEPGLKSEPSTSTPQVEPPKVQHRFSLLHDKADDDVIDTSIRAGVELSGATPWILMFAILVASIGLNTNSTAVIIGAMLISPLMGPIVGIGYGIGIFDLVVTAAEDGSPQQVPILSARCKRALKPEELQRAQEWLKARTKSPGARLMLVTPARGRR